MEFRFGSTRLDEEQIRELRIGVGLRVDQLKKVRKSTEDAGLPVDHIDMQLAICRGDDTTKGLLALMGEQTTALPLEGGDPVDETVQEVVDERQALVDGMKGEEVYLALAYVLEETVPEDLTPRTATSSEILDLLGACWKDNREIELVEGGVAKVRGGKNPRFWLEHDEGETATGEVSGILLTRATRFILNIGEPVQVEEVDEDAAAFEESPEPAGV